MTIEWGKHTVERSLVAVGSASFFHARRKFFRLCVRAVIMSARGGFLRLQTRLSVASGIVVPAPEFNRRCGFTFAESIIAMTVLAMTGAALLTSVASAVSSCNDSIFRTVGRGVAEQLMDEIAAASFPTGSTSTAGSTTSRAAFVSIDDYSGWRESPPQTKAGQKLGSDQTLASGGETKRPVELQASPSFIARFTRSAVVERVTPNGTGWDVVTQHTSFRRVTIQVSMTSPGGEVRTVAELTRVFAAIPTTP